MDGITLWFVASSNLAQAVSATIFHQLLIFYFIFVAVGLETHGGKENARLFHYVTTFQEVVWFQTFKQTPLIMNTCKTSDVIRRTYMGLFVCVV